MVSERGLHGLLLFGLSLFWVTALWGHQSADLSDVIKTTLETIRHFVHGQGDWTDDYIFGIKRNLDLQLLHETGERKAVAVILYCTTNKCDSISERLRTMSTEKNSHMEDCMHYIKGHSEEHEDLGGQTQKTIIDAIGECPNSVIVYDALQGMALSEAKVLVNVLSEGGSLTWDGKTIKTTNSLLFLIVSGTQSDREWRPKELLETARHRVYEMIVGDSEDNETRVSIARALRRRFEEAVPISQDDYQRARVDEPEAMVEESTEGPAKAEEPEVMIEESRESPEPTREESQASMETPEQEAVTETTPEDVFNMRGVEDALPQAEWPLTVEPGEVTPEMGFQERAFNVLTQSVLTMGIHGIVNWMVGGRVTAAVSSPGIISAFTAATLNNMPKKVTKMERDMKVFLRTAHEFMKLMNHTAEGGDKHKKTTIGSDDRMSDDMADEIKKTLHSIKGHMENITSILDECACDDINDGWKTSRGEETWIERIVTWILGARDNMVTWTVGVLWDIFGWPALRGAMITKNGWQLLGVMIVLGKIINWIGSIFACLARKIRMVISIVRGLWWTMRFAWFCLRFDWEGLKGLWTGRKEGQQPQQPPQQPQHQREEAIATIGDARQERMMQEVREEIRNLTEGVARNAEEMEERVINQQRMMQGTIESSLQTLNQRVEELDDRIRRDPQAPRQQARAPSMNDWIEAERRHLGGGMTDHDRRRLERQYRRVQEHVQRQPQGEVGEIQPDVHIDQVKRQQVTFGPAIQDLQRMLPKGKEDISQFSIRLTTLMDKIRHPEKYMVAFERVFNIAHPRIQAQLGTLGCDNAQEWSRVQRILHEFTSDGRSAPRIPFPGRQQVKSNGNGYLCEHCKTRGHSARDCPRRSTKRVAKDRVSQTNVVQTTDTETGTKQKRLIRYNLPLKIAGIPNKISFLLDTGAETNVLSESLARTHQFVLETTSTKEVTGFDNSTSKPLGEVTLDCSLGDKENKTLVLSMQGGDKANFGVRSFTNARPPFRLRTRLCF